MMHFNEVLDVALSEGHQTTGRELKSVYQHGIKFRLQLYGSQNGSEKHFLLDLSDENEPGSVYRYRMTREAFISIANRQRVRISYEKFPEMIVAFARKAREEASKNFFSCSMLEEGRSKAIKFELTEHTEYKSASILSLKMKGLEGDELIEQLTNVIKKNFKQKMDLDDMRREVDDLNKALNDSRRAKEAALRLERERQQSVNIDCLRHDLQELRDKVEDLSDENERLYDALQTLDDDYESKVEECQNLLVENETLKARVDESNSKYDEVVEHYRELYGAYDELLANVADGYLRSRAAGDALLACQRRLILFPMLQFIKVDVDSRCPGSETVIPAQILITERLQFII